MKIDIQSTAPQPMTADQITNLAQFILSRKGNVDFGTTSVTVTPATGFNPFMAGIIVKASSGKVSISGATEITDEVWNFIKANSLPLWMVKAHDDYGISIGNLITAYGLYGNNVKKAYEGKTYLQMSSTAGKEALFTINELLDTKGTVEMKWEYRNYLNATYPVVFSQGPGYANGSVNYVYSNGSGGNLFMRNYTSTCYDTNFQTNIGTTVIAKMTPTTCICNGETKTRASDTYTTDRNVYNKMTFGGSGAGRLYYIKTWNNEGVLTHYAVPIADGKCLDFVTGMIYTESNEGVYSLEITE